MTVDAVSLRTATADDVERLVELINGAYRGDASKRGWTTEADLLHGQRTDAAELASLIARPDSVILLGERNGAMIASVLLQHDEDSAYLGMLVVDPVQQAVGLGKQIMRAAEDLVQREWDAKRMWMTVLIQRTELIAFYERRGYRRTGRFEPWPSEALSVPQVDGLMFEVLEKDLV